MRHLLESGADVVERFARDRSALLVLDFDGTVAPFASTPEAARIDPSAEAALRRLTAESGSSSARLRVGVASGRRIDDLRRLLPPLDFWIGLHGLELAIGEDSSRLRFDPGPSDRALDRIRKRLAEAVSHGGRVEDKQHSIALHVRGLEPPPLREEAIVAFARIVESERAAGAPLECLRGHLVAEARPTAAGKHRAIADVRSHFGGGTLAFVGDDVTDEEVFRAFPREVTVVVMDPPRTSDARYYLRSPGETATLLVRLSEIRDGR
ncbi:MAG TPA: trehalose-phosphatase [Candidatus Binatia bacterium]|nr:trehalose-phosphatase [Candidatus Binatia bacterium]